MHIRSAYRTGVAAALLLGLLLRLLFHSYYPLLQGDALTYGDLAKNWLMHGVYGFSMDAGGVRPSIIRLPGYPAFLALCFRLFGIDHYNAVLRTQVVLDLVSCLLIGDFLLRAAGRRAAMIALWLACLCPFTSNYAVLALTETPSIFCVALALNAAFRFAQHPRLGWPLLALAFAFSWGTLLRPDGALLPLSVDLGILFHFRKEPQFRRILRLLAACALLTSLPFIPWTIRNYRTFHVFQPLSPRYANEVNEPVAGGFNRWVASWCVDYASTDQVYWNANSSALNIRDLPTRAFDSPAQYRETADLLEDYNAVTTLTPAIDARFNSLAEQRIRAHPVRFYLGLPLLRLADMWLRPRVDMLPVTDHWWHFSEHNRETEFSWFFGFLNLGYLALAGAGAWKAIRFLRTRQTPQLPLMAALIGFVLLRCLLLATIEAPEARYTLECYPVVLIFAAFFFVRSSSASRSAATTS